MPPQPERRKATLGSRTNAYTPALSGDRDESFHTEEPAAPPARPAPTARPAMTRRVGFAIQKAIQDEAKSAYVVDLDLRADCPPGFTHWLAEALIGHARLTPAKRATVRRRVAAGEGRKVSRSYDMSVDAIEAMERAIIEDRTEQNHVESRAEFFQTAVLAAIERVKKRSGRDTLPPAPDRLPRQPVRR